MRITICTGPILPVPAIAGGAVHRFWAQMAPRFVARGHRVRLFARAYPGQAHAEVWKGVEVSREGGYAHGPNPLWNLLRSWLDARSLSSRLPEADVLISNDIALPRWLAKRTNTGKLIVAMGRQPKHQLSWYPRVDGIAAASRSVARQIGVQAPDLAARTKVLPYAIDHEAFSATGPENRDQRALLYAGRIHQEKGLSLLIAAFRHIHREDRSASLTIIGPWRSEHGGGGETYLRALQQDAQDLPIRWLEPEFDPSRLASIYRQHGVFVYPSLAEHGETFGLAPLEAMACGCVPVVSALPCFDDFLEPGTNGINFNHLNSGADARLAAAVSEGYRRYDALAPAAQRSAQRFGADAVAEQWLLALSDWQQEQ